MKILINRTFLGSNFTIGDLFIDGKFVCNTLEDKVRAPGLKIAGQTAIPEAEYRLIIDHSNRFNKMMPHILDVPDFEGIRIHSGNSDKDT